LEQQKKLEMIVLCRALVANVVKQSEPIYIHNKLIKVILCQLQHYLLISWHKLMPETNTKLQHLLPIPWHQLMLVTTLPVQKDNPPMTITPKIKLQYLISHGLKF